jgi:ketosteroid isomerase-like protein
MDSIEKQLVDIEKAIVKLFNKKDIASILKFFSPEFSGFSSTRHERLTSLKQLKKTFLHYLEEGDPVKYSINGVKATIFGEGALTTFYWKVEIHKKKKVKTIEGRGSHMFIMMDSGWTIVHEHYSKAH